jgi:hypothetical protein
MLVGIASHLLWDGFTHAHGLFVDMIPLLQVKLTILGRTHSSFRFLQHGCTLLGGAYILYHISRLRATPLPLMPSTFFKFWTTVVVVMLLVSGARIAYLMPLHDYEIPIITTLSGILVGLMVASALMKKVWNG